MLGVEELTAVASTAPVLSAEKGGFVTSSNPIATKACSSVQNVRII